MTAPQRLQPGQCGSHIGDPLALGFRRPGDHDDGNAEGSRRYDLCVGGRTARVLRHNGIDMLGFEQAAFGSLVEGTTREDETDVRRKRHLGAWRINRAGDIAMQRGVGESTDFKPAETQKHAARPLPQGPGSRAGIGDVDPTFAVLLGPRGPVQCCEGDGGFGARGNGVARNVSRVGMRRVDYGTDALVGKPFGKAIGTTKSADAGRKRQRRRVGRASGERQTCDKAGVAGNQARQVRCLCRAAENENAHVPND